MRRMTVWMLVAMSCASCSVGVGGDGLPFIEPKDVAGDNESGMSVGRPGVVLLDDEMSVPVREELPVRCGRSGGLSCETPGCEGTAACAPVGVIEECARGGDASCLEELCGPRAKAGDVSLRRGSDVARFPQRVTFIDGDLTIRGDSSLASLEQLGDLRCVSGSVLIQGNEGLLSLKGLGGLVWVGGDLEVSSFSEQGDVRFPALNGLEIGGSLVIEGTSLASVDGLESLQVVGGDVHIEQASELRNLDGLRGLERIDGHLRVTSNPKLERLGGLGALESLGSSSAPSIFERALDISLNASLRSIASLSPGVVIDGDVVVASNDSLVDVSALELSGSVEQLGSVRLVDNTALDPCAIERVRDQLVGLGWMGVFDAGLDSGVCEP